MVDLLGLRDILDRRDVEWYGVAIYGQDDSLSLLIYVYLPDDQPLSESEF
jgi:hypothetical protein